MILECKSFEALCELKVFKINGIDADYHDFGTKEDRGYTDTPYVCGNMKFEPILSTQKVLDKYKISVDEYNEICDSLDKELSFGSCGWCV